MTDILSSPKRRAIHLGTIVLLGLLSLSAFSLMGAAPRAYAATYLSSWCTGPGLSWDGTTSTCTVTGAVAYMDVSVEISNGETLLIGSSNELTISFVTLTVDSGGTITIGNSGGGSIGLQNLLGTIINSGSIIIENSGSDSCGFYNNGGRVSNPGIITVENYGSDSYGICNQGTITDSGTITVENTGGTGISNEDTVTNTCAGTITIENSGGTGIDNDGTISGGTITIVSSGTYSGTAYTEGSCTATSLTTSVCDQSTSTCATTGPLVGNPGDSFYDTAVLTWPGEPSPPVPTGTVTYHLYSGGTCAPADEITGTVGGNTWPNVVNVGSSGSVPDSAAFAPLKAGTYSFMAVYSGDSSYDRSLSTCASATETFVVTSQYPFGSLAAALVPLVALVAFVMISKRSEARKRLTPS